MDCKKNAKLISLSLRNRLPWILISSSINGGSNCSMLTVQEGIILEPMLESLDAYFLISSFKHLAFSQTHNLELPLPRS